MGSRVPSRWVTWVMGSRVADADGEKRKSNVYTDRLQRGLHVDLKLWCEILLYGVLGEWQVAAADCSRGKDLQHFGSFVPKKDLRRRMELDLSIYSYSIVCCIMLLLRRSPPWSMILSGF